MKIPKLLTAAFIAATALVSTASAQTKIYITGSTAFRSATVNAIDAVLSGTVVKASDNASFTSANAVTWTGGTISVSGTPIAVTIKASWSGSAAGIQTVAGSLNTVRFLPDGATGTSNADPRNTSNPAEVATPDICMADNLQTSTPFTSGSLVNGGPSTYASLTSNPVGVVSFIWAASNGFPAGMSMTKKLAEAQFSGIGAVPIGFYTGLAADTPNTAGTILATSVVYATGRDPDSGTRITTLAESGYGVNTFVSQWKPTSSGTNGSISAMALYPIQSINGVSTTVAGNSGESSGSTLRNYLTNDLAAGAYQNGETGPSYLITYLGVSDYNSVKSGASGITKPAVPLKWNGVDFSQAAVMNGQYTFWGYEYLNYRPTLGNGTTGGPAVKLTFATNLKNGILGTSSATLNPNVKLGDMNVTRAGDGGPITNPNF